MPTNEPESLLRVAAVTARVGLSKSHIYDLIREGQFPAPIPLGAKAVAWQASKIDKWIAERIKAAETK